MIEELNANRLLTMSNMSHSRTEEKYPYGFMFDGSDIIQMYKNSSSTRHGAIRIAVKRITTQRDGDVNIPMSLLLHDFDRIDDKKKALHG